MLEQEFKHTLVRTIFCCLACDGELTDKELRAIAVHGKGHFPDYDERKSCIEKIVDNYNQLGHVDFFRMHLKSLKSSQDSNLSRSQNYSILGSIEESLKVKDNSEFEEMNFAMIIRSHITLKPSEVKGRFTRIEEMIGNNPHWNQMEQLEDTFFGGAHNRKIKLSKADIKLMIE